VAHLAGPLALGGPRGRQVRLERHLDHHRAARARHLPEQPTRISHVLEHMREHAQLILIIAGRDVGAVEALDAVDTRAPPRDRDGRLADLEAAQRLPEAAPCELAEQRPVAAADVEDGLRSQAGAGAQADHVIGLPDRPEGPPARVESGLLGRVRVGVLVEAQERPRVLRAHGLTPAEAGRPSPLPR